MGGEQRQAPVGSGQSDLDPSNEALSTKTRYTLLVTQQTEGFIETFAIICSTRLKPQISAAVHPDTIRAALAQVNLDQVLGKDESYQVFKTCYGWRSWLLAPEDGVRGLLREALQLYEAPLRKVLENMYTVTLQAAKLAMKRTSKAQENKTRSSIIAAEETIQHLLLHQAENLIKEWHGQTLDQLTRNLHAEAEFPAPERFAKLKKRLQSLLAEAAAQQAARQTENYKRMLVETLKQLDKNSVADNSSMAAQQQQQQQKEAANPAVHEVIIEEPPSWSEFYMGWLEKRSRHGLWQRRWFALSLLQRKLWYFGAPEEQPARGMADLVGARIVELEEESVDLGDSEGHRTFRIMLPGFQNAEQQPDRQRAMPVEAQQQAAAMTGVRTKTISMALTLRASSATSKRQWCDMLNKSIVGIPLEKQVAPSLAAQPLATKHNLAAEPAALSLAFPENHQDDGDSPVGRKISTKVFQDEDSDGQNPAVQRSESHDDNFSSSSSSDSSSEASTPKPRKSNTSDSEERTEEENERIRAKREQRLFEEISAQSCKEPTPEELAVLDCVVVAVREYVQDAVGYLTEQASKIIADGMLPMGRAVELHEMLLRVLIPASTGVAFGVNVKEKEYAGKEEDLE